MDFLLQLQQLVYWVGGPNLEALSLPEFIVLGLGILWLALLGLQVLGTLFFGNSSYHQTHRRF